MMSEQADYTMTQTAFDQSKNPNMGPRPGDDSLLVKFYLHPVQNQKKSAEEGRPMFDDVEFVEIMAPGDKTSIIARAAFDADKARFPRHYAAFKNKQEDILDGTPLSAWPMVTRAQVEEMAFFNVRTVENLADMADVHAQKFMGVQKLRSLARVFLEDAKKKAPLVKMQKELEERDTTISGMQTQLDAMNAKLEEISAK